MVVAAALPAILTFNLVLANVDEGRRVDHCGLEVENHSYAS